MNWNNSRVLVTGGASFIGSHLVDALVELGARVRVVDNLSSGKLDNIREHIDRKWIEFYREDLRDLCVAQRKVAGMDIVFHLAADHGGRGYVDLHQADCATNLALDGTIFMAAREAGVAKVVYASSGCVYPNHLQTNPEEILYLTEDLVKAPYDADNTYGWAKLMAELTLKAYHDQYGLRSASCRYFTVYGERGVENHAVMAMIARAFLREDPYVVWGTGQQVRNWTYVGDIVRGTILAAEKIDNAIPVNLGTMERVRVLEAVQEILSYTGHQARLDFHPEMPTGPYNRVADNTRAQELLGWSPQVNFKEGVRRTIDWYFASKDRAQVAAVFQRMLTER